MTRSALTLGMFVALALCVPDRASAQWNVRGSQVSVTGDYKGWDDNRPDWREGQLAARHNTKHGTGLVRLSHVERGALSDDKVEIEIYPLFKGGYAALGVGFARDATVYASSTWSAEVYANLTPQVESSIGVRQMNFANSLTMITASLGAYYRDYVFGARVYHVLSDATLVMATARRYMGSESEHYIGAQLAGGTAPAQFRTPTDLDVQSSRSIALEGQYVIAARWELRVRAEVGSEKLEGRASSIFRRGRSALVCVSRIAG